MSDRATLLPSNASPLERDTEQAVARTEDTPVPLRDLWQIDKIPAELLPYVAWAFSVDTWRPSWPDATKRSAIRTAVAVHRKKGTRAAVRAALDALELDLIIIREWWEVGGPPDPYTFEVEVGVNTRGLSDGEFDLIADVIERTKNVRSHVSDLRVYLQNRAAVPDFSLALLSGETCTVYPFSITELTASSPMPMFGAGIYGVETCTIYPL